VHVVVGGGNVLFFKVSFVKGMVAPPLGVCVSWVTDEETGEN